MRVSFLEGLVMNLEVRIRPEGRAYLPKAEAYKALKHHTGQDFGDDAAAWRAWIKDHPTSIHDTQPQTAKNRFVDFIDEGVDSSTE